VSHLQSAPSSVFTPPAPAAGIHRLSVKLLLLGVEDDRVTAVNRVTTGNSATFTSLCVNELKVSGPIAGASRGS